MSQPEFDRYSGSYNELLKDPIRDRFAGNGSQFFHTRKRDVIRSYFRRHDLDTHKMSYLDLGCGRGELLNLLRDDFASVAGCDLSPGMLHYAQDVDVRVQTSPEAIPFGTNEFDFVSAVCVYHHTVPAARLALAREAYRVLRPGGVFGIIEHNPYNAVTRLIVSRTPVDAGATLLTSVEARKSMRRAGFVHHALAYFLFFPQRLYNRGGAVVERYLEWLPLGGQYAIFAHKQSGS